MIDHEGVGFMLADNLIDLKQSELLIDWCAGVLDEGSSGGTESSMAKVAVSEALYRTADRCVQAMGGTGVTGDTVVEQVFREVRAFRIYDGPSEVHKTTVARRVLKQYSPAAGLWPTQHLPTRTEEAKARLQVGLDAAHRTSNHHAASEMQALLDELEAGY